MKTSFVLYTSYMEQFQLLTDEQAGVLIKAILAYEAGEEPPEMDGATKIAFSFIKNHLDDDAEKYKATCEKRRAAGRLGGRPQKADDSVKKQKNQKVSQKSKKSKRAPDNDNEYDNDNESENESDNESENDNENDIEKESVLTDKKEKTAEPTSSSSPSTSPATQKAETREFNDLPDLPPGPRRDYEADFEAFWELYPKKRSKALAREAWYQLLPGSETVQAIMESLPRLIESEDWRKGGGKYIPNPANWLKAEGWEDQAVNFQNTTEGRNRYGPLDEWLATRMENRGDGS